MAKPPIPKALWVYGPDGLVGTLHNTDPLSFSCRDEWLSTPGAEPIHPHLPLAPGQVDSPYVAAFFENLLPEGDQRTVISMREQVMPLLPYRDRIMVQRLEQRIQSISNSMGKRFAGTLPVQS